MGVESLEFVLRAWGRRGQVVRPPEFLDRLSIAPGDQVVAEEGPGVPRVRLLAVAMKDFAKVDTTVDAGARDEAFAAAVHDGLVRAAAWLARQPPGLFEELRAAGRIADMFIGGWMDQDQFDLDLPPEFPRACGALGLTVSICTND
jgi:hypothetical protein